MPLEPPFSGQFLESVSNILSDQLTNSLIAKYLPESGIADIDSNNSKFKRIHNAFVFYQNRSKTGKYILVFIQKTLSPVRYINKNIEFEAHRSRINSILLFEGFELQANGKIRKVEKATTIVESQRRAEKLKEKLIERNIHHDVLKFCRAELVEDNYFHAVFEATKSIAEKIRQKAELSLDGSELIDRAFGLGTTRQPTLAFNTLQTESEESEHKGLMNLIKGIFGMFRNTTAHAPRITWTINEQDALDCLTIVSLIHRTLDKCVRTRY